MQLAQNLRQSALLYPERTAIVDSDVRYTWREFEARVRCIAGGLKELGLGEGDRVAVLAHNSHRYLELFYAAIWAGGIAVPINTRWAAPEVRHALDDSGARLLVVDGAHVDAALEQRAAGANLDRLILAEGGEEAIEGFVGWEALARAEPVADAERGGDDVAALYYTGGTTGRSKGVMLTHANLIANAMTGMINMDIRASSVHLHTAALFHMAGGSRLFTVTLAGGTHVFIPRFDVESFLDVIQRDRVTITVVVPTMLNRLVQRDDLDRWDLSSLDLLCYGSSPMPEALIRALRDKLPSVRLLQSYGMTELSPVATVLRPEFHVFEGPNAGYAASAGRPVYNADVRIVDADDAPVATGEIGEVCVRGPMVMKGYWNLPELTAETLRGGWMHTGDAGYMDARGFVFVVDRVKDMIVSGGENVYCAEVEATIFAHPSVLECAVIGVPSEQWGESVHAVVVPRPGAQITEAELIEHCRAEIAGYKCPRSVTIQREELPKSGPGKILKTELRKPWWEGRARAVS